MSFSLSSVSEASFKYILLFCFVFKIHNAFIAPTYNLYDTVGVDSLVSIAVCIDSFLPPESEWKCFGGNIIILSLQRNLWVTQGFSGISGWTGAWVAVLIVRIVFFLLSCISILRRSFYTYIILAVLGLKCGMWDLQSSPLQHKESLVEAYELLVEPHGM